MAELDGVALGVLDVHGGGHAAPPRALARLVADDRDSVALARSITTLYIMVWALLVLTVLTSYSQSKERGSNYIWLS